MRPALPLALCLSLAALTFAGCGPRRGVQTLSDDAIQDFPPGSYPPLPLPAENLRVEATHPTGLAITIARMAFEPDRIGAQLRIVNPSDKNLALNKYGKMHLKDDLGNAYALVWPEGNKDLEVLAGHRVDTLFVFQGGFAEQARTLTLITNDGPGGESNLTGQPKLVVGPVVISRPPPE